MIFGSGIDEKGLPFSFVMREKFASLKSNSITNA
jgi:hypothetical protein